MDQPCLITVGEFIKRVYGELENGATPPSQQTITRKCRLGLLPAVKDGVWFINWTAYQKMTGNNLVDKVLFKTRS